MRSAIVLLASAAFALACDSAPPTSPTVTTQTGVASSGVTLSIAGVSTLTKGSRTQLKAFAVSPGTAPEDVTAETVWSVDNPSVITIEATGWITGQSAGSAQVSARRGKTEASLAVTVSAAASTPSGDDPPNPGNPNPKPAPGPGSPSPTDPSQCLPPPLPPNLPEPVLPCPSPLPLL